MKRTLISMLLVAASSAAMAGGIAVATVTADTAHPVCDGGTTGGKASVWGGSGVIPTGTTTFTRSGFDLQCSANVFMSFNEVNSTTAVVASTSAKGNQYFGGHSNGGAVGALGKCAASPCTANDVTTGIDAAKTAASSTGTGG